MAASAIKIAVIFGYEPVEMSKAVHAHLKLGSLSKEVVALPPSENTLGLYWMAPSGLN